MSSIDPLQSAPARHCELPCCLSSRPCQCVCSGCEKAEAAGMADAFQREDVPAKDWRNRRSIVLGRRQRWS